MTITFGDLRSWRASGVTSASEKLRADIKALEKARDVVETDAVPDSYEGLGRWTAEALQTSLLETMDDHVAGLTSFERVVYAQAAKVTSIEKAVQDIDTDAAAPVLEHIAEEQAREAGIDDFEVRIEDLEDKDDDGVDDDPTTDSRGSWHEGDRVLRIDEGNLDDPTIIGTVAHEVRHAQQHKAVDDLPWWPWEDYHGPPGVSQEEVEDWEDNFDDYKTSEEDGFDAYRDQPVEKDARETGGAYLDDLDDDELDRIREEAR